MSELIPCSVQVLVRNGMPNIVPCLESLREFGEVIVQDGFSTDGTREVAASFRNVTLLDQDRAYLNGEGRITDFSAVRNASITAAKYDWMLVVDADEITTQELREEVRGIVERNAPGVYQAFRRFFLNGVRIERAAGYPALQIRLFHRTLTNGYAKSVHERLWLKEGVSVRMLRTELPVPLPPAEQLTAKYERYLKMEVERLGVVTWGRWIAWMLLRHLRSAASYFVRALWIRIAHPRDTRLPWAYEWQFIHHALATITHTFPPRVRYALQRQ